MAIDLASHPIVKNRHGNAQVSGVFVESFSFIADAVNARRVKKIPVNFGILARLFHESPIN